MNTIVAFDGATDPEVWGKFFGALGPGGFALICVGMIVLVVVLGISGIAVSLTGIPRWKIPGLAWAIVGVWHELHGLRVDYRAVQRGDVLPDLEPLSDSVPPPPAATRGAKPAPARANDAPRPSRPSTGRR